MINLDPLARIVVPTPGHQDIDITVGDGSHVPQGIDNVTRAFLDLR
jgi:hypothetical protein